MPVSKGPKGVKEEMHRFKHGQLHSGKPNGPIVKKRSQAVAIALHASGMSKRRSK